MRYAILEENHEAPLAYLDLDSPPSSFDELADLLAGAMGFASRDDLPGWSICYVPVH